MSDQIMANKALLIKWGITVLGTLIVFLIPDVGWYTGTIKTFFVITVFSLFVIAFEFWPAAVMVILLPGLYALFQVAPLQVIMSPWTTTTMLMCTGCFFLAAELECSGLLTRVAYYLMAKADGSYLRLLIALYLVGVVLTIFTFGSGYMIMAPLCAGLCGALLVNRTKMGAGIAMACMLGTCTAKAFTYPATTYAILKGASNGLADDISLDIVTVMLHNFPMFFVCLFTIWVVSKWYKPEKEANGKEYFEEKLREMGGMSVLEKKNAGLLVCVFLFMMTNKWHGLAVEYGFIIIPWLAFLPFVNAADENTFKKMNWQMLFFIGGCMSIGTVASYVGFGEIIAEICTNIFSSGNVFVIFGTVFALIFVLNFLMTPLAIWSLLTAPLLQVATTLGLSKLPFLYCLVSCAEAIVLPYEYVPYLVVYAFGMMTMGDFVKLSIVRCGIYIAGFMLVLIPYWMLIGLI